MTDRVKTTRPSGCGLIKVASIGGSPHGVYPYAVASNGNDRDIVIVTISASSQATAGTN